MQRFKVVLFAITALLHLPFVVGLHAVLARVGAPSSWAIALTASAALVAALDGRIRRAMYDRPMSLWRLTLIEEPYYVHWSASVAALPLFLVATLAIAAHQAFGTTVTVGSELGAAGIGSYAIAIVLALYGVIVRRRWIVIRTIDVPIVGLGRGFEGYRIAQLSDLHIGGLWPRPRAQRWIDAVNALDADLVALTGDYVTSGTEFHADIADALSAMRGRDGAFAVMGNHDYFGDGEPLVTLLRERGVYVLRNEHRTVVRGSDRITVAGVDDTWTKKADVDRTLAGRAKGQPTIVLAHDPQLFPQLAGGGADLVLSGHTHWGQIALPFFAKRINLSRMSYRYHAGLYRSGASTLYVNPGLGTTGPPIRFGVAPEITVLRLRAA